jgi:SAM-dependent methyltransferase
MLQRLRERFARDEAATILEHSLDDPLPPLGAFDAVVSSFAIHHVSHQRKRALYEEIRCLLAPGGVFCNMAWKWMELALPIGTNPNPEPRTPNAEAGTSKFELRTEPEHELRSENREA